MTIKIKISRKPVDYRKAVKYLEKRVEHLSSGKGNELLWILNHPDSYTAGVSSKSSEILDRKLKVIKTNRGGKVTWHGKGQNIYYFVIDLSKKNKDIRKFVRIVEKIIIDSLKEFKINSFADRKNIGIWVKDKNKTKKIAAIGIRVKKWTAYHGFAININNDLKKYHKIIPCGIKNKGVTNLIKLKNQNYKKINKILIKHFLKNLKS